MFKTFQDYAEKLHPLLDRAMKGRISFITGSRQGSCSASIYSALTGGKRIRGSLLCLVSNALGAPVESALDKAVAIEMIHGASLIHDDFVDQDTTRREMPATWTLMGARRAVLLGDLVFASAIEMMNTQSREDGLVVSRTIALISKGAFHEQLDPLRLAKDLKSGNFDHRIYGRIIDLKTGVLFGAACRLGAITAGADPLRLNIIGDFGSHIGTAYQIADDLKEVKSCLSRGSITSKQAAELLPAVSYFVENGRECLPPLLLRIRSALDRETDDCLKAAKRGMEMEIERRIRSAESILAADFPVNMYTDLLRRAPRDLLKMFYDSP